MNLLTFLQECTHPSFYQERSFIVFKHKTHYPLLFASYCTQLVKKNAPIHMSTIDLTSLDEHELKAQLSTSFLGNRSIYSIGNINALDARKQKPLIQYLVNYHGPHIIFAWSDSFESKSKDHEVIELNDIISMNELLLFGRLLGQQEMPLVGHMLSGVDAISLEHGCLMMQYASVMSRQMIPEFNQKWIHKLTTVEQSLFTLSSDFFAKNRDSFYEQWAVIIDQYGPPFWTAYWSEQLFRAASFVAATAKQQHAQAKKISYKLPFSFIKKDWRSYSAAELSRAHDFIFQIDSALKQGGEPFSFDLFYMKFFLGEFK